MSSYPPQYKSEHFNITRNLSELDYGTPQELKKGVYTEFTNPTFNSYTYDAISTGEARAAGEALIALADEIEADQPMKPRYPEEPVKYSETAIVQFRDRVPVARRGFGQPWKFITLDREFTWKGLCDFVGEDVDFEVLYPKGE